MLRFRSPNELRPTKLSAGFQLGKFTKRYKPGGEAWRSAHQAKIKSTLIEKTKSIRIPRAGQIKIKVICIPPCGSIQEQIDPDREETSENNASKHSLAVLPLETVAAAVPISASVPEP